MGQVVLVATGLPSSALDAAAAFHAEYLPQARALLASGADIAIRFDPADHPHGAWRLAAVQELAREAAPLRVNGVVGDGGAGTEQVLAWFADATAITGQILAVEIPS
ncbi:Rossmann fold domain-containing protein [Croceibacterium sp. TMG7-5b_MA50]|uniref:Rossmann fold domain-containing protein n=1 Tax=Croceibacterium sp. TMG7-5b_MA50 TaxID=3121290 RepID=UPI00322184AE